MSEDIRTERRFGVTADLTNQQRRNLYVIRNEEGWSDVLDVMEMCCIEIETALINTPAEAEAAVLANHKKAQVAWQVFTHLQAKIDEQIALYLSAVATKPLIPEMTREELQIENILDPTRPLPDYLEQ